MPECAGPWFCALRGRTARLTEDPGASVLRGEDVPQLAYGAFVVVLGGDRFVQVQGAAADQARAVAVRERGQRGDGTAAGLLGVAVVQDDRSSSVLLATCGPSAVRCCGGKD